MQPRVVFPVIVGIAIAAWWLLGSPSATLDLSALDPRTSAPTEAGSAPPSEVSSPARSAPSTRARITAVDGAGAQPSAPQQRWSARGLVLDVEGAPVPGVEVAVEPERAALGDLAAQARAWPTRAKTLSDGAGRFEVELEGDEGFVIVYGGAWSTLYAGHAKRHAAQEDVVVVAAKKRRCAGHVLDDLGVPVQGARVQIYDEPFTLFGFPRPLDRAVLVASVWTTDRTGAFDLEGFVPLAGRRLHFEREGSQRGVLYTKLEERHDWEVVMARIPATPPGGYGLQSEPILFGFVRDASGTAVSGARVQLAHSGDTTDAEGRFEFERAGYVTPLDALVAMAAGKGVAIVRDPMVWTGSGGLRLGPIELRLTQRTHAVRGRLIDAAGDPVPDFEVRVLDPTGVALARQPTLTIERGLESGADWPRTDAEGRFVLPALLAREYTLLVVDTKTDAVVQQALGSADTEVLVTLPEDLWISSLTGTVLDQHGRPVRGVEVATGAVLERHDGPQTSLSHTSDTPRSTTGPDGRFVIHRAPRRDVQLELRAQNIRDVSHHAPDEGFEEPLVINVERRALVRVQLDQRSPMPDMVQFFDRDGGPELFERVAPAAGVGVKLPLERGASALVTVSETTAFAAFFFESAELERVPLRLSVEVTQVINGR